MTTTQIQYWTLKENQRSNLAQETEINRSNVAREKETKRHNKAGEKETNRHNVVVEVETERHNRAIELLTSQANAEQARHNQMTESLEGQRLTIDQQRLQLGYDTLAETHRTNVANEQLRHDSNALGWSTLSETIQHNRATEGTNLMAVMESVRADKVNEALSHQRNIETQRSNMESEELRRAQNKNDAIRNAQQLDAMRESRRHNQETERAAKLRMLVDIYNNAVNAGTSFLTNGARTIAPLIGG